MYVGSKWGCKWKWGWGSFNSSTGIALNWKKWKRRARFLLNEANPWQDARENEGCEKGSIRVIQLKLWQEDLVRVLT